MNQNPIALNTPRTQLTPATVSLKYKSLWYMTNHLRHPRSRVKHDKLHKTRNTPPAVLFFRFHVYFLYSLVGFLLPYETTVREIDMLRAI